MLKEFPSRSENLLSEAKTGLSKASSTLAWVEYAKQKPTAPQPYIVKTDHDELPLILDWDSTGFDWDDLSVKSHGAILVWATLPPFKVWNQTKEGKPSHTREVLVYSLEDNLGISDYEDGKWYGAEPTHWLEIPPLPSSLRNQVHYTKTENKRLGICGHKTPPEIRGEFGIAVREARIQQGLTQTALATLIGLEWSTISTWERGRYLPTPRNIEPLEMALRLPPQHLLRMVKEKKTR